MENIKDILSTIAGLWIALTVGFKTNGIALPPTIETIAEIGTVISIVLLGYFQGKNPDGTTKEIEK